MESVLNLCVAPGCNQPFGTHEMPDKKTGEELGRQVTAAGPMHFGCYWNFQRQVVTDALEGLRQQRLTSGVTVVAA